MASWLLLSLLLLAADACMRPPSSPTTSTSTTSSAPRCNFYGPSSTTPTKVNELRPGDIGIIGSIGDSDSAALGARANTIMGMTQEDRDISFASGTSDDWEGQTSLANMIGQYNPNPNLLGGSSGTNDLLVSEDYQAKKKQKQKKHKKNITRQARVSTMQCQVLGPTRPPTKPTSWWPPSSRLMTGSPSGS